MTALSEPAAEAAINAACHLPALPTIGAEAVAMADASFTQRLTHETFLVEILTAECDESHARRRIRRIEEAKFPRNKRLSGLAVRYARLDLLCLDEVGNVRLDPPGAPNFCS